MFVPGLIVGKRTSCALLDCDFAELIMPSPAAAIIMAAVVAGLLLNEW